LNHTGIKATGSRSEAGRVDISTASIREQLALELKYQAATQNGLRDAAASENKVLPIHRWVPWIAGFSADFVQDAISTYLPQARRTRQLILDPFAGVGTTLIEGLKANCDVIGCEINPFASLVAAAKVNCVQVAPDDFQAEIEAFRTAMSRFGDEVDRRWAQGEGDLLSQVDDLLDLRPSAFKSRIPFFSAPVEAKFLYALARTRILLQPDRDLFRAALGATMVSYSNYSYEPSLASRPGSGKPLIANASVGETVYRKLREIVTDIEWARQNYAYQWLDLRGEVFQQSYFDSPIQPNSVSLVVTSPPYMNNYHYVRNTRPQLYWLDLLSNGKTADLEQSSFGKFWQTVRQGPPVNLDFTPAYAEQRIAELRPKNAHKGYYGGQGWANYVATYLNDSNRFISCLKTQLKSGGRAVIVVGNSIIQGLEFKVDHLLAEMADNHGLSVEAIHIVRTKRVGSSIIDSSVRNGDANGHRDKTQLYDAAVVLKR